MSSVLNTNSMATIVSKRSIANFTGYVCLEEQSTDQLEITEHPVQQGSTITDHAFIKPPELSIQFIYGYGETPLSEIYSNLIELQASRDPFSIVTGKRVYNNMLIKSLGVTTDVTSENILSVRADFRQIIIVAVETTIVPAKDKQSMPKKTNNTENQGDKKATPVQNGQTSESDLSTLVGNFGGLI